MGRSIQRIIKHWILALCFKQRILQRATIASGNLRFMDDVVANDATQQKPYSQEKNPGFKIEPNDKQRWHHYRYPKDAKNNNRLLFHLIFQYFHKFSHHYSLKAHPCLWLFLPLFDQLGVINL